MTPRVRRFSDRLISGCSPSSLLEDERVLYCRELAGIMHRFLHMESMCLEACVQESGIDDHILCE